MSHAMRTTGSSRSGATYMRFSPGRSMPCPKRPRTIKGWSPHRLIELAPVHWTRTRDLPDARERLAANPYRALTLVDPPSGAR
jgi:hypothetical protein